MKKPQYLLPPVNEMKVSLRQSLKDINKKY